jgi:hypothetical protein
MVMQQGHVLLEAVTKCALRGSCRAAPHYNSNQAAATLSSFRKSGIKAAFKAKVKPVKAIILGL